MRLSPFGLIATSLLAVVSAFPVPSSQALSRDSTLSNSNHDHDATPYKQRNPNPAPRALDAAVEHYIYARARTVEQKQATKDAKTAKQAATKATKAEQGKANAAAEREKAKVTFGKSAKESLDHLGLHGKDRKAAKGYHKQVVKEEMKTNGASTAKVVHLEHKGGSVATEKNHITTHFYDKNKQTIPSKWTDKSTGEKKDGELHHVYPDQHPGVTKPKSLTDAQAKPAGPSKYAVAAKAKEDKAAADKATKDKEKADRVAANRAAGLAKQAALKEGKK